MRIGLVCPYSWDVPGGVQFHVRDLAEHLIATGHDVSVLAPADDDQPLADYVVPAGRAIPVPYNGSVARVLFGPVSAARVRRWVGDGDFEVLHVHEPAAPSLSLLACWAAAGPIVGTFHTSSLRSRAMAAMYPLLYPALEKIGGRIAVSEDARRTLVEHLGGDPVLIPNGVFVDRFAAARPRDEWCSEGGTLVFLGRVDEPRKGLATLFAALPEVLRRRPRARLLVAGPSNNGDSEDLLAAMAPEVRKAVTMLGQVDDADKASLLRSADVYVAPNTGGESFGIVLAEAMAAGAVVVASDLDAFRRVLDGGRCGVLVPVGDAAALAGTLVQVLADQPLRDRLRASAREVVARYDWGTVASQVLAVYETVAAGAGHVGAEPPGRLQRLGGWTRGSR